MKKAVIFDMDGLMLDSKKAWNDAETRFVESCGKEFQPEVGKKYHGLRVQGMVEVMIREYQLPLTQKEGEKRLRQYAKENFAKPSLKLLPGCKRLVEDLSASGRYAMAVASSASVELVQAVVERFAFTNYFQALVSGEEVQNGKPAPDVFLRAAELLKVEPMSCLVLEDVPNGIKAAKAAGMLAIAVSSHPYYPMESFEDADKFVKSLDELNVATIAELFGK